MPHSPSAHDFDLWQFHHIGMSTSTQFTARQSDWVPGAKSHGWFDIHKNGATVLPTVSSEAYPVNPYYSLGVVQLAPPIVEALTEEQEVIRAFAREEEMSKLAGMKNVLRSNYAYGEHIYKKPGHEACFLDFTFYP